MVAANASYLVTSLLNKEVYLTLKEGEIEKEHKKEKEEEAQKKAPTRTRPVAGFLNFPMWFTAN